MDSSFKRKVQGLTTALICWAGGVMHCIGATYNSDGTMADIQSIHDNDVIDGNGDIITIPAAAEGVLTWTDGPSEEDGYGIRITKSCTLLGDGISSTNIGVGNGTYNGGTVLSLEPPNGGLIRLANLRFYDEGSALPAEPDWFISMSGTGNVTIENVEIDDVIPEPEIQVGGAVWGVAAGCVFHCGDNGPFWLRNGLYARDGTGSSNGSNGDYTWYADGAWGTDAAFYVENCHFIAKGTTNNPSGMQGMSDFYGGAQFVMRYSDLDGVNSSSHGTGDGSGSQRGPRKIEYYRNTWRNTQGKSQAGPLHRNRGGPAIYAFNEVYNWSGNGMSMDYYRFRSPHGRHGIFPTFGIDRWTVEESGTSDAPAGKYQLEVTGAAWADMDDLIFIGYVDSRYTNQGSATIGSVDVGTDEITFTAAHPFSTGDMIYRQSGNGTAPAPIVGGTGYFVAVVDTDTITLSAVPSGATLDLTATTTGGVLALVGDLAPGFHKFPHISSPVYSYDSDTLTGKEGQQSVWRDYQWFLGSIAYEILDPLLGLDMPGAGRCYSIPGYGTLNLGETGQWTNNLINSTTFTTNFSGDVNRLIPDLSMFTDASNTEGMFVNNVFQFTTTGTLPAPLATGTDYYVVEWDDPGNQVEVSATLGGAPITLTDNGTGTHTLWIMMNQDIEGVYEFGNSWGLTDGFGNAPGVWFDRHAFKENPNYVSGGGASGVGVGLLSARPTTPSLLNSAYWATDTEILYAWRDTDGNGIGDTWVNHWSEYTYPHPLRLYSLDDPTDEDPPTPNPMTFAVAPAAAGPSSITMTATAATDATTPVSYRIRRTNPDMSTVQSSWQSSTSFTVSGLLSGSEYGFEVQARDSAVTPNSTTYSSLANATTDAVAAGTAATATSAVAGSVTIGE